MIIRSQDKESIINFGSVDTLRLSRISEIGVIQEEYQTSILYDANDTFGVLGTYSTEEKAIKVLDMIQDKYCMMNASNCMMAGTMRSLLEVTKEIQDKTIKAHRDLYVFEMPADNEVEV